jgi:hypothetical protein
MKHGWMWIVLVIAACGGAQQQTDNLGEAIRSYNDGVRWGRYSIAASRLPATERSKFTDEMDEISNDLRITDYEVVRVDAKGSREAHVQIKLQWYKESEQIVRETHALQTWERHGRDWLMVDESRMRGAPMPGLADHESTKRP